MLGNDAWCMRASRPRSGFAEARACQWALSLPPGWSRIPLLAFVARAAVAHPIVQVTMLESLST